MCVFAHAHTLYMFRRVYVLMLVFTNSVKTGCQQYRPVDQPIAAQFLS